MLSLTRNRLLWTVTRPKKTAAKQSSHKTAETDFGANLSVPNMIERYERSTRSRSKHMRGIQDPATVLDQMTPLMRAMYEYWRLKCGTRAMPRRADIDITDLKAQLGQVVLLDVLGGGHDFQYRVYGTKLSNQAGGDLTGRKLSSFDPDVVCNVGRAYVEAVEARRAVFSINQTRILTRFHIFERLILPLSADGDTVDQLLVYINPLSITKLNPYSGQPMVVRGNPPRAA